VFGSTMLEVAMGLVLVYLLLSLICTALQESLEAWLKIRASQLEKGLRVLLQDPDGTQLLQNLYNHPLMNGLFSGDYDPVKVRSNVTMMTSLPSYMPAASFAVALMDTIVRGPVKVGPGEKPPPPAGEITIDSLRAAVTNSATLNASMQRVMLLMLDSAQGDLAKVQANIETWFNSGMDRVSGWYKRQTQWVLIVLGIFIAVALNVDSLKVTSELYRNDTLRAVVVAQAESIAKNKEVPAANVDAQTKALKELKLPIGWQDYERAPVSSKSVRELLHIVRSSLLGWLITAFAISFGAPFWFDLLSKIVSIRSSVKPQTLTPATPAGTGVQRQPASASLPRGTAGVAAVPDISSFKPHEWTSDVDPQGGVL
jgi:hypothetical protein